MDNEDGRGSVQQHHYLGEHTTLTCGLHAATVSLVRWQLPSCLLTSCWRLIGRQVSVETSSDIYIANTLSLATTFHFIGNTHQPVSPRSLLVTTLNFGRIIVTGHVTLPTPKPLLINLSQWCWQLVSIRPSSPQVQEIVLLPFDLGRRQLNSNVLSQCVSTFPATSQITLRNLIKLASTPQFPGCPLLHLRHQALKPYKNNSYGHSPVERWIEQTADPVTGER